MKSIAAVSRVKVSADGRGVVSHAGVGMLRELAELTGLSMQVTAVLADTYRGPWTYAPGEVFADLAAVVASGADCIDAKHLAGVRAARAHARAAAWAAGAAPAVGQWLHLDIDATLTIDHSDNQAHPASRSAHRRTRRNRVAARGDYDR